MSKFPTWHDSRPRAGSASSGLGTEVTAAPCRRRTRYTRRARRGLPARTGRYRRATVAQFTAGWHPVPATGSPGPGLELWNLVVVSAPQRSEMPKPAQRDCSQSTRRLPGVQFVDYQRRCRRTGLCESEEGTKVTGRRETGKVQARDGRLEVLVEHWEPIDNGNVRDDGT